MCGLVCIKGIDKSISKNILYVGHILKHLNSLFQQYVLSDYATGLFFNLSGSKKLLVRNVRILCKKCLQAMQPWIDHNIKLCSTFIIFRFMLPILSYLVCIALIVDNVIRLLCHCPVQQSSQLPDFQNAPFKSRMLEFEEKLGQ